MSIRRVSCPACRSVLAPARPLPEGAKGKCPACGALFRAWSTGPAVALAASRRGGRDEDEGDGEPYRLLHEDATPPPKVRYAPKVPLKDRRGPALEAIMRPSNMVLGCGALGFLGWLGLLLVVLLPALMPVSGEASSVRRNPPPMPLPPGSKAAKALQREQEEPSTKLFELFGVDLAALGDDSWLDVAFAASLIVLGAVYAVFVMYGAVRLQKLESRLWGMAASVMVMLPLNSGGLMAFSALLVQLPLRLVLDDSDLLLFPLMVLEALVAAGAGAWCLLTCLRPEVEAGINYQPA
jgi:hypothetical protein